MSSTNELSDEARKEFLLSFKDPQVSKEHLSDLLNQIKMLKPELLSDFQPVGEKDVLSLDRIDWNDSYFCRHMLRADHNFAHERIKHLIEVRDHLRKQKIKGYVPSSSSPSNSDSPTESPYTMTSEYAPSAHLQKFVTAGDLLTIRTALRMEMNNNSLTSAELKAALAWTKAEVPDLFEAYSEQAFAHGMESDRRRWDSQYYDKQIVYLKTNFSEARLLHLIEVRDLLRQQDVEGFVALPPRAQSRAGLSPNPSPSVSSQPKNPQPQHNGISPSNPEHNPVFKTALIIGGAVAALAILLITLINGQN